MINYLVRSFKRKIARRITKEYPPIVNTYQLKNEGTVEFANWDNPLMHQFELTQPNIDFFRKFIKEGDLAIDIGSNIGDTTVPMGLATGKAGVTLGFDPNPVVFKILEKNASLNKDKTNIVPVRCAISSNEESFYFVSSEASFSNGGISPTKDSSHGKYVYPEKIKGINLNNFLVENYPDHIDKLSFIKIDTEGYDKEIVKSIGDLIEKCKPVIVAESFGKNSNEAKMELYQVIAQHGYDIFYFEEFDINATVKPIATAEEMTVWNDTINIYAIPK